MFRQFTFPPRKLLLPKLQGKKDQLKIMLKPPPSRLVLTMVPPRQLKPLSRNKNQKSRKSLLLLLSKLMLCKR